MAHLSAREKYTKNLKSQAPETLVSPLKGGRSSDFGGNRKSQMTALKAYKKYNNWASDDGVSDGQKKQGARHKSFPLNKNQKADIVKKIY